MVLKDKEIFSDALKKIYRIETAPYGTNAYIVACKKTDKALLIDAPGGKEVILKMLPRLQLELIVITHGHADHLVVLEELHELLQIPVAAHEDDFPSLPLKPEAKLSDGDIITCGEIPLAVLHTPGHTRGSICLQTDGFLFSGDTIFPGGPGKTATAADFKTILSSIENKIMPLPGETVILPGHGQQTVLENERILFQNFTSRFRGEEFHGDVTWI